MRRITYCSKCGKVFSSVTDDGRVDCCGAVTRFGCLVSERDNKRELGTLSKCNKCDNRYLCITSKPQAPYILRFLDYQQMEFRIYGSAA
jgi:hypothetical protein